MTGRFDPSFDSSRSSPSLGYRVLRPLLRALIPLGTVGLVAVAIWVGTRNQESTATVLADSGSTETPDTRATAVSDAGVEPDETVVSVATTGDVTPTPTASTQTTQQTGSSGQTETTQTPTSATPTGTTALATGRVVASTRFADSPGGSGSNLAPGTFIAITGDLRVLDGSTWYEADLSGAPGWVAADSIELTSNNFSARPCGEFAPEVPATALAYQPGTAEGEADGVAAVEHHVSSACDRVVLYLGETTLGDGPRFASGFPAGLSIVDLFGRVRVELADDLAVVPEWALRALPVGEGEGIAIAAKRPDGKGAYYIDVGRSRLAVSFLARPARVVLDFAHADDVLPGIGGGVIVNAQSISDALGAGDGRIISITGFARLADGLGEIALREAPGPGDEIGSGFAVNADFGGTSRVESVFRSWFFYETPRVGGEWAEFQFTLGGLDPGAYELMLGLGAGDVPSDIENPGIFQVLVFGAPN